MIYRINYDCVQHQLEEILAWADHHHCEYWRGRADQPGQYRFEWRIRVEGPLEVMFLLLFADRASFVAEPDYARA